MRVIIVAPNASTRFGGEAILPWHYFRRLREQGVDAHLVVHARTRRELLELAPELSSGMHFAPDRLPSRALQRLGDRLPASINGLTVWPAMGLISSIDQRRMVRRLAAEVGEGVVHEPTPVSPKQPSVMFGLGAPVVIGPMNGGMEYPCNFRGPVRRSERLLRALARRLADLGNRVLPGKRRASLLLVANPRTRAALPPCTRDVPIREMVENGVDTSLFGVESTRGGSAEPRFAFVGRLVDWKRVDLLLRAFARTPDAFRLDIVGDGPERAACQELADGLGLRERVVFRGFVSQAQCASLLAGCDALVLSSMFECGGAVVLEAMASGLAVVATDWGGPADYVVPGETGLLIPPTTPEDFVGRLASAMSQLGNDRELARRLGEAGRARALERFDWNRKLEQMMETYASVIEASRSDIAAAPASASKTR